MQPIDYETPGTQRPQDRVTPICRVFAGMLFAVFAVVLVVSWQNVNAEELPHSAVGFVSLASGVFLSGSLVITGRLPYPLR